MKKILLLLIVFVSLIPFGMKLGDYNIAFEINSASALQIGECTSLFSETGTCVANGILSFYEIIIFYFTQLVLVIVGYMFDLILFFSLNSDFYRGGLMQTGWEIVRDFTNIIFIFALLTMAFKLVLNQDDGKTKSTLVKTILVSLVINFSLFFTFIVIDSSNLLARVFYNRIEADGAYQTHQQDTSRNQAANNAQTKITQLASELTKGQPSVSLAIASKINPQKIITQSGADNFILGFAILTSAGILNILMIYVFGSLALLFLGRSLGLMISGIIAPLAFASITVPFLSSQKYIGFGNWIKEMIALAFMAPVFMFFMYLIVTFLGNEGALRSLTANNNTGVLATIMQTYIFFMIIGGLILLAKKVTTSMAGELGSMAAKGVAGVTTALATGAAIAATGGAAAAGLATRGVASGVGVFAKEGSKTEARAKRWNERGKRTMAFKADITKIPGFNAMAGATGVSGLGDKIGKVTGQSARGLENKGRYAATAVAAGAKDMMSGRSYAEQEAAEEKKRKERREQSEKGDDGLYGWERKLEKEKESAENSNIFEDTKTQIKVDIPETDKKLESDAATELLKNPDIVKKETKAIEGLEDSIKNLTAQYNAATGNGNTVAAAAIQEDMNIEKLRLDARKKGIEISKSDMEDHIVINHSGDAKKALRDEKSTNEDKFGSGTSYESITGAVNVSNETLKGKHEHEKKQLNKLERKIIQDKSDALRAEGKEKQADTLLKKMDTLLTDSTKERKSGDEKK